MPTVADIYIDGPIYPENYIWPEEVATSLYRVKQQVTRAGTFRRIRLNVFSPGGYCLEGWAIHDWLLSLGVPIDSYTYGQCASFASIFHLMGEERLISPNCQYLIHHPWDFFVGNYKEGEKWMAAMKKEADRSVSYYAARTGNKPETLDAWMADGDLIMSPQETVERGFSTSISFPQTQALASQMNALGSRQLSKPLCLLNMGSRKVNPDAPKDFSNQPQTQMANPRQGIINAAKSVLSFLTGEGAKALDVELQDGSTLVTNSTGGEPVIGDTATINGAPAADGDYTTKSGTKISVKDGVITDVVTADEEDSAAVADSPAPESTDPSALATLRREVAALSTRVSGAETRATAAEAKYDELSTRVTPVLSAMVSQEPVTQVNRQPKGTKGAAAQSDREKMLAEHLASFGITKED